MHKHYDGIDIFFIITISFYFIVLFLFVATFLLNYLELSFNLPTQKGTSANIPELTRKKPKLYKSNISYIKK